MSKLKIEKGLSKFRKIMELMDKKGFTLVELCVVIGLISIIVTMCVGFIILFDNQSKLVLKTKEATDEVSRFQTYVDDWVQYYDKTGVTISASKGSDGAVLTSTGSDSNNSGTLTFNNKVLTVSKGDVTKQYNFATINDVAFEMKTLSNSDATNVAIQCDMNCGDNKPLKLIFSLMSNTKRDRYLDIG